MIRSTADGNGLESTEADRLLQVIGEAGPHQFGLSFQQPSHVKLAQT